MTGGSYRCLHVPVDHGPAASGAKLWLILLVLAVVAWQINPWIILGPLGVVVTVTIAVWVARRQRLARLADPTRTPIPVTVTGVTRAEARGTCPGCGWRIPVAALEAAGHRIPVCAACRRLALRHATTTARRATTPARHTGTAGRTGGVSRRG